MKVRKGMRQLLRNRQLKARAAATLRADILRDLGCTWANTPHPLLDGDTPDARITRGDLDVVRNLLYSTWYVTL